MVSTLAEKDLIALSMHKAGLNKILKNKTEQPKRKTLKTKISGKPSKVLKEKKGSVLKLSEEDKTNLDFIWNLDTDIINRILGRVSILKALN